MPIVAIAALGINDYYEVPYRFANGATIRSSYPIHAFLQQTQLQLDETIVLLTEGARKKNWEIMSLFLADVPSAGKVRGIDIPDGKNEEELWTLFTAITEAVPANADLYVDITHGLRHLPTFLLMACAYLRVAKDVNVRSVYYGAFDLGVRETIDGRSTVVECPIIELAPFVALFDWASAAAAFKASGDATLLAERLEKSGETLSENERTHVRSVSKQLRAISLALEVAQPDDAIREADSLRTSINRALPTLYRSAMPFRLLIGLLEETFRSLQRISSTGVRRDMIQQRLQIERQLIDWYFARGRITLASLLLREWIITRYMLRLERNRNLNILDNYEERSAAAQQIPPPQQANPELRHVANAWRHLREGRIRNLIAHAGRDANLTLRPEQILDSVGRAIDELRNEDGG